MKKNIFIAAAFLILSLSTGYTKIQGQDKKADKEKKRLELQKQVDSLIESKQFIFVAKLALPMWGSSILLTPNANYLKFDPSYIVSYMPYFGDTYSADYNIDPGVKFEGKPEEFDIKKLNKAKGYDIRVKVSIPQDTFDIFLHVGTEGSANLTISSYRRNSISYVGSISGTMESQQKEKGT